MHRLKHILGILLILIPLASASADDATERHGVGLETGFMKLIGGEQDFSNVDQNLSLRYRYGLKPNWTLQAGLQYGQVHPGGNSGEVLEGMPYRGRNNLYTTSFEPRVDMLYHFMPEERWSPYAGAGMGIAFINLRDMSNSGGGFFGSDGDALNGYDEDGELQDLDSVNFTASLLGGVEYYATPDLVIGAGARLGWMASGGVDNIGLSSTTIYDDAQFVDANNGIFEAFIGFTWFFGSKDKDGDGILNKFDACPKIAEDFDGFEDEDGCPEDDNDGDGIPDTEDRCPDAAEDRDGYQDEDGCPELDNDGDNIPDSRDRCPDDAEDMDGFQDRDGCPDPDNDGDGVLDTADRCPHTPAGVAVDAKGCPVVKEIKETLTLEGVTFKSGSAELETTSEAALNRVAGSLRAWPDVKIEVQGHSDSSGNDSRNLKLSQARAQAVADYLIAKGVAANRITARGYGERMPIADNATTEGRAANRRVEIHRVGR